MNTTPQIPTIKNDRDFAIPNQSFQQTAGQAPPSMTTAQMPSINTNQGFAPQYQPLPQGFLAEASTSTAGSTAGTPLPTRKNDQSLSQQCQPPQENVKKSPFIDIAPWPLADNGGNPVTQYQPQPPQQMIEYPPLLNIAPKPRTPPVNNNSQHQPPQQMVEHPHISPTPFRPGNSATTSTNPSLLLPMFNKQSLRIPDKSSTRDSE